MKARFAVPVAAYHEGTTAEYVARALGELGYEAELMNQFDFFSSLKKKQHDFYFCVDSGGPLDLMHKDIQDADFRRVSFWYIDYRHNKKRPERNPDDFTNCVYLTNRGGWVFQSQFEDFMDCLQEPLMKPNVSWLPLAADQNVWTVRPDAKLAYDVGFVGHVWDNTRQQVLDEIQKSGLNLMYVGPGRAWKESAALLLNQCRIGFNISSFFDQPKIAYDVNMRVFETLSCGVPLLTNKVPGLSKLMLDVAPFVRTYTKTSEVVPMLKQLLQDEQFLNSGLMAREWVEDVATYEHRMRQAISTPLLRQTLLERTFAK